jgi:hypothetical protein
LELSLNFEDKKNHQQSFMAKSANSPHPFYQRTTSFPFISGELTYPFIYKEI